MLVISETSIKSLENIPSVIRGPWTLPSDELEEVALAALVKTVGGPFTPFQKLEPQGAATGWYFAQFHAFFEIRSVANKRRGRKHAGVQSN
jgi:hypothetical protein